MELPKTPIESKQNEETQNQGHLNATVKPEL